MRMAILFLMAFIAGFLALPVKGIAGKGGTHTDTQVTHKTETQDRHRTRTHTVHEPNTVEDVTHVRDVTRVHPVHHVTDVTRVLHHVKRVDSNEYATHRNVAPAQVERTESTEHVGKPAHGSEHTVTRYHDVNEDDYSERVHEVTGSPIIDHYIHRHVNEVTVQPVVHEHDITRVVVDNVHKHRTDHQAVTEPGKARTIVKHRREDVDP